jgi:hypothetical protein
VDGLIFPLGEPINIEGHAADPAGVEHIEIWINSELAGTIEDLSGEDSFVRFSWAWTPPEAGDYLLMAAAHGDAGEVSMSALVTVHIGSQAEVEPVETEEPPDEAATTVEYWADPPEIEAGACSTLHWLVDNAQQVLLGSTEMASHDDFEVCLCQTTRYRLTVTDLDGIDQEYAVLIQVNGVCDETPPPAPLLYKPLDEEELGPFADTILRWDDVTDESGIDEYQIQVERHSGDHVWHTAPGSPYTGVTLTEQLLTIDAGYTYRWRVRAVDGAGNIGPWSGWFTFSVPLT